MLTTGKVDRGLGKPVLRLLLTMDRWVHRRVETVRFLSDRRIERQVSVDLEPDQVLDRRSVPEGPLPVPLTLLTKDLMVGFDIQDAAGISVPVCTRSQNGTVALSMLVSACEAVLDQRLTSLLIGELRTIAHGDPSAARDSRDRLIADPRPSGVAPEVGALRDSPQFPLVHALLSDLANNFLLAVPLDPGALDRRVITFSYQEWLGKRRPALPVHASNLGWVQTTYLFDAPAVAEAGSYHFEIRLPEGAVAYDPRLFVHAQPPPPQVPPVRSRVSGSVAQLYVSGLLPGTSAGGCVSVGVAPRRDGIVHRAVLSGLFALAVLMLISGFQLGGLLDGVGDVAPVLLLIAASTLPTYLMRPREHVLVSRILYGVRAMVVLSILLMSVAAVVLAFGVDAPLWPLAAVQAVATLCLLASAVVARRVEARAARTGSVHLVSDQRRFLESCLPRRRGSWWQQLYVGRSVEGQRAVQPGVSSWQEIGRLRAVVLAALDRRELAGNPRPVDLHPT